MRSKGHFSYLVSEDTRALRDSSVLKITSCFCRDSDLVLSTHTGQHTTAY